MRQVSPIDPMWIQPYIPTIQSVNVKQLAGISATSSEATTVSEKSDQLSAEELEMIEKAKRQTEAEEKKRLALARLEERRK